MIEEHPHRRRADHNEQTRLALVENDLGRLIESVDRVMVNMITSAHLAPLATRAQLDSIDKRVADLERGSLSSVGNLLVKIAAGMLTLWAVVELVLKVRA